MSDTEKKPCDKCDGNGDSGAPCEIKCDDCDGVGFMNNEQLTHEKWGELKKMYGDNACQLVEWKPHDRKDWNAANDNVTDVDWTIDCTNYDVRLKQ